MIFVFIAGISKAAVSPFRNLGFDEANTNHVFDLNGDNTYFYGPIGELLPGWQLSSGTNAFAPNDLIGFNLSLPGSGYATLYSTKGFPLGFGRELTLPQLCLFLDKRQFPADAGQPASLTLAYLRTARQRRSCSVILQQHEVDHAWL